MAAEPTFHTLSTCPYCDKAKEYFNPRGISFEHTEYDQADGTTQARIQAELESEGAGDLPFARIGDQVVEGHAPRRYAELLSNLGAPGGAD